MGSSALALAALCLALLCSISSASVQEAQALLDFQSSLDVRLRGWNSSNIPNLCVDWAGVACNAAGNVTSLSIDRVRSAFGTFNRAIFRLTELVALRLNRVFFFGECPPELFQFPQLRTLLLYEIGCKINWPTSVPSTLSTLTLKLVNITDPMPNIFPWDTMTGISVYYATLPCPLPQGLLDRMQRPNLTCQFQANAFTFVDGMICGQISVLDFPCRVFSPITPYQASAAVSRTNSVSYSNFHLEFQDYTVRVFGKTRAGAIHRDDYFSLGLPPIQPIEHALGVASRNFHATPFEAPVWADARTVYVNYTMFSRLNEIVYGSFVFQFDAEGGNINVNGNSLKFSAYMRNLNATYSSDKVVVTLLSTYHTQHSPPGGVPLLCPEWDFTKTEACSSSVANVTFDLITTQVGSFLDTSIIGLQNEKVFISFGYGLIGERDGIPLLDEGSTSVIVEKYLTGVGLSNILDRYLESNRTDLAPRANAIKDQSFLVFFGIELPKFNTLFYDPDISLALLFDVDAPAAGPSSGTQQNLSEGSQTIGLIVGLTMAAVVAVAAVVGVVLFVRMRSSQMAQRKEVQKRLGNAPAQSMESNTPSAGHVSNQTLLGRSDSKWVKPDIAGLEAKNVVVK